MSPLHGFLKPNFVILFIQTSIIKSTLGLRRSITTLSNTYPKAFVANSMKFDPSQVNA